MPGQPLIKTPSSPDFKTMTGRPEDFLTLDQRLDAIADVLAEMTLESMDTKTQGCEVF